MRRFQKPSKTLGFCQVRRVAHGCFIIFHMRARMENNINTLSNPAHSVELSRTCGQCFETSSQPESIVSKCRQLASSYVIRIALANSKMELAPHCEHDLSVSSSVSHLTSNTMAPKLKQPIAPELHSRVDLGVLCRSTTRRNASPSVAY